MFNRKEIKHLNQVLWQLEERVRTLESTTNFYETVNYDPYFTYKVGSVRDILAKVLDHLGLKITWVCKTDGYAKLEEQEKKDKECQVLSTCCKKEESV